MPPVPERKRVSRACDACRLHKQKCDGGTPTCGACAIAGRVCTTNLSTKKRGLRGGYLRRVEALLGWVLTENGDKSLQRGVSYLERKSVEEQRLARVWKESRVGRLFIEAEDGVGELLNTATIDDTAHGKYEVAENLSNILNVANDEPISFDENNYVQYDDDANAGDSGILTQQTQLSAIAPPFLLNGWQERVQIYLLKYHCWLPILDKSDLFRIGYGCANGIGPSKDGERKLFHVIMALTHEDHSAKQQSFQMAVQKPPWEYRSSPQLQIQLNIMLILYEWGMGDWTSCLGILKFAINDARALGIDRQSKSRQRLLWLGCCLLDTLLAFRLNKTPLIRRPEIEHSLPIDVTGAEEWEPRHLHPLPAGATDAPPSHTLSTFQQTMSTICWLNDILSLPPSPDLFRSFEDWSAHLPPHCQLPNALPPSISSPLAPSSPSAQPPPVFPHTLLLHLLFPACQIARVCHAYPSNSNIHPTQPPSVSPSYPPSAFISSNPDPLSQIIHLLRLFALGSGEGEGEGASCATTPIILEPFFHCLATSKAWLANQKRFLPREVRGLLAKMEGEWPAGMGRMQWGNGVGGGN
ncbi:MAG: hypothetical protein Q9160_001949 [Pyrenula sp. 1 TL-2023]